MAMIPPNTPRRVVNAGEPDLPSTYVACNCGAMCSIHAVVCEECGAPPGLSLVEQPSLFDELPSLSRDYRQDSDMTIQEQFLAFHGANPWVYDALRRLALDLVRRGRTRIGIGMLFEVLRWHYWRATEDANSDFKLNNNYRSRYARRLMADVPELADAFETRELKAA